MLATLNMAKETVAGKAKPCHTSVWPSLIIDVFIKACYLQGGFFYSKSAVRVMSI